MYTNAMVYGAFLDCEYHERGRLSHNPVRRCSLYDEAHDDDCLRPFELILERTFTAALGYHLSP